MSPSAALRSDPAKARVAVVTAGHLSTCPRMLKAADALAEEGYAVRVIATRHEPWASETDTIVRRRRQWPLTVVNYRRDEDPLTYWRSGIRQRAARRTTAIVGATRTPFPIVARAFARVHDELVSAVCAEPNDFVYGGTTGALAAVAEGASRQKVPYALDLEDLHSAETLGPDAESVDALAVRIERTVLLDARFLTAASGAIGGAYADAYGVRPAVIHNTFPLPAAPPSFRRVDGGRLRLYWFSQTIGPGRGLELAIVALGRASIRADLVLRGRSQPGYLESLQARSACDAPRVQLTHVAPAEPDAMVELARDYDVGLALEEMAPRNRQLCVTNKAFTYMLAGMAVAITDTPGQHALGIDLGLAAAVVAPGDVEGLAAAFRRWADDPETLACAKRAAWAAAVRRWHWEHGDDRGRLCALVAEAVGRA